MTSTSRDGLRALTSRGAGGPSGSAVRLLQTECDPAGGQGQAVTGVNAVGA